MNFLATPLASAPATEVAADTCPKCGDTLVDPKGMGWCKKCGYCRSLQESPVRETPRPSAGPSKVDAAKDALKLPFWFWVMILGMGVVAGASALVGARLPAGPKFERALWCTIQIGLGILLIWVTQFVALIKLAPKDATLNFSHAILPGKIWGLIGKRLPAMAPCLWVGAWCVTAILSAVYFIGGLGHWNEYLPGKNKNVATVPKAR
jgi:hypothetical protein